MPRSLAVSSPKAEEVHSAAKALGLQSVIDPDRAHPTTPWQKEGRVLIQGNYVKVSVIRRVAEKMKSSRTEASQAPKS